MLDMVIGILFIFIILLVVSASSYISTIIELQGLQQGTKVAVENICKDLEKRNIKFDCDPNLAKISFDGDNYFDSGKVILNNQGQANLIKIASTIRGTVLCDVTHLPLSLKNSMNCDKDDSISFNAIFIEGHADITPLGSISKQLYGNNLKLSALRAGNFYGRLGDHLPEIEDIKNQDCEPIFAVSGYGDKRPVKGAKNCDLEDTECLSKNRRIELRFFSELDDANAQTSCY